MNRLSRNVDNNDSCITYQKSESTFHPRTGHEGPEGGGHRYVSTLSLTSALDGAGWLTTRHAPADLPPVPIVQVAGWLQGRSEQWSEQLIIHIYIYFTIIFYNLSCGNGIHLTLKIITAKAYIGPEGSRRLRLPGFSHNRHIKVVRLSALRTGRLYLPGKIPGIHFCYRLSRSQSHNAEGNRNRSLPACSAVPQSTVLPLTPL
jgi:hypothetical protein